MATIQTQVGSTPSGRTLEADPVELVCMDTSLNVCSGWKYQYFDVSSGYHFSLQVYGIQIILSLCSYALMQHTYKALI